MKKRLLALLLALALCLALLPTAVLAAGPELRIGTLTDLEAFRDAVNAGTSYAGKTVKLTADLDLGCTEDSQWTPIGTESTPFQGTFDGGGHTVTGLYIYNKSGKYQGFFGYLDGGTVKALSVNGYVLGDYYIGGIVGKSDNGGTLQNCSMAGDVKGNYYVGGIVGKSDNGSTVENCQNTADIARIGSSSANRLGGIVGNSDEGSTIRNCSNSGTINGYNYIGGIVGYLDKGSVENCINSASVAGNDSTGGIVGFSTCKSDSPNVIRNCTNTGSLATGHDEIAGIVGDANKTQIENCGSSGAVNGSRNIGGIVGKLTSGSIKNCWNTGDVTGTSSNVGGVVGEINSSEMTGCRNTGNVKSTCSNDVSNAGGVAGRIDGSEVTDCQNCGTVTGVNYVGGVVGILWEASTLKSCYNTGDVAGIGDKRDIIGGVIGRVEGSTVDTCYNTGDVSGISRVGGIAGQFLYTCTMQNCYNTGDVSGNSSVGCVAGDLQPNYEGEITIRNCYHTGVISGSSNVGSVFGYNSTEDDYTLTIEACCYLDGCEGENTTLDKTHGTALREAEFQTQTSFTGWDFSDVWTVDPYLGRPILRKAPEKGSSLNPYIITYDPGDHGCGTVAPDSKYYNTPATLSCRTFVRLGYVQTGWVDGDGNEYALGGSYTDHADVTLYPVWELNWSGLLALGGVEVQEFPFTDVPESAWYYDEVKSAWENGLVDGTNGTEYRPENTLTVAQAIKLAAALHQLDNAGRVTLTNGKTYWYDSYVEYAVYYGIIEAKYAGYTLEQMNAAITRAEFVHIFHGAMSDYYACNTVADNAIPDVKSGDAYADEIYEFYRAGILTGSDGKGTFHPESQIRRSEVAAILIRMYDTNARQAISLG